MFPSPEGKQYRGLAATQFLADGEVAVSIPSGLSLSIQAALSSPLASPLSEGLRSSKLDEFSALAVYLLFEAMNETSFYRPFLCSLPRHIPLPVFSPIESLKEGAYGNETRFLRAVETMGKVMADNYELVSRELFDRIPTNFPSKPSFGAWLWSCSVIFSRAWGVPVPQEAAWANGLGVDSMHVLAPVADMVNHHQTMRKVKRNSDGGIEIVAGKALERGEEITISYGDKCNLELLAHYGFVLPSNPTLKCEWDRSVAKRLSDMYRLRASRL
mmetsp:Transcript_39839/g.62164  ORF Transcript_39839/g.62164 Transcript_39839/m.62164 type:complete len:272 (+) Transcript_39839:381-1196(+)